MKYLECSGIILMKPNSTGAIRASTSVNNAGATDLLIDYPGFVLQAGGYLGQVITVYVSINGSLVVGANTLTNQVTTLLWDGIKWLIKH